MQRLATKRKYAHPFLRYALLGLSLGIALGAACLTPPAAAAERPAGGADILLPEGYRIELVASGFTFPTAVGFDDDNRVYVLESGYAYGEVWAKPRLLRLEDNGKLTEIAVGFNPVDGPWNGMTQNAFENAFFVSSGGYPGRIYRITTDGRKSIAVDNLPFMGDHHTNRPALGPDGLLYFGQGTATNSGVVGPDNHSFGWLARTPDYHDIPCQDIILNGVNFKTPNPLTPEPDDTAVTGAFVPFGTPTKPEQVIPGQVPCHGAIMRAPREGGKVELVAWGLRNPFGIAFSPDGQLYATENSFDVRGSRPVANTPDLFWRIQQGAWYGWPDFSGGRSLSENNFQPPQGPKVQPLLAEYPDIAQKPLAEFGVHTVANGLSFSNSDKFGFSGEAFVAEFGDLRPATGGPMPRAGVKIVRVDVEKGTVEDFAINDVPGPASEFGIDGFERPIDARFDRDGEIGLDVADRLHAHRNAFLRGGGYGDRDRRRSFGLLALLLVAAVGAEVGGEAARHHGDEHARGDEHAAAGPGHGGRGLDQAGSAIVIRESAPRQTVHRSIPAAGPGRRAPPAP